MSEAQTAGTAYATVSDAATAMQGLLFPPKEDTQKPAEPTEAPAAEAAEPAEEPDESQAEEGAEAPDDVPDETEEDADAEDTDAQPQKPRTLRVKIDGEELEVPEEEAVKGYQRQADYTKKTMALSEKQKAFEAEQSALREERQRLAASLEQLTTVLESHGPEEPDWEQLRRADPAVFASEWAAWDRQQKQLASARAARDAAQAKVQADQTEAYKRHLETERARLLDVVPQWKDQSVQDAEKAAMREFALGRGFTDAELAAVSDHRTMVLLRDAMLYHKAQAAKPVVAKKIDKVRMATPGAANEAKKPMTERTKSQLKLRKSGRVDDAADVMKHLL